MSVFWGYKHTEPGHTDWAVHTCLLAYEVPCGAGGGTEGDRLSVGSLHLYSFPKTCKY